MCVGAAVEISFFLFVRLTLNPHIFLKPQCFLKRPKHGILYAYRAEPEAQRPLDSASNGLSQSGPVNKSALRVFIVTGLIVVGALFTCDYRGRGTSPSAWGVNTGIRPNDEPAARNP